MTEYARPTGDGGSAIDSWSDGHAGPLAASGNAGRRLDGPGEVTSMVNARRVREFRRLAIGGEVAPAGLPVRQAGAGLLPGDERRLVAINSSKSAGSLRRSRVTTMTGITVSCLARILRPPTNRSPRASASWAGLSQDRVGRSAPTVACWGGAIVADRIANRTPCRASATASASRGGRANTRSEQAIHRAGGCSKLGTPVVRRFRITDDARREHWVYLAANSAAKYTQSFRSQLA